MHANKEWKWTLLSTFHIPVSEVKPACDAGNRLMKGNQSSFPKCPTTKQAEKQERPVHGYFC